MTVRSRLLAGFGAVVVLLLVPSLFAVSTLTQLRHLAVERRSGQATAVASLGRIQALGADIDRLERSLVATSDSMLGVAAAAAVDSLVLAYDELGDSPFGELASTLAPSVEAVRGRSRQVQEELRAGRIAGATAAFESLVDELAALERETAEVARAIDTLAREELARAERLTAGGRRRTVTVLLVALLVGLAVVGLTTRALTEPLRRLRRAMASVADGAFEAPPGLPYDRSDELGELARSFRTMTARLDELARTKAEFLGMASHELKTPLNVIAAYAELIEDGLGDDVSERHRDMITAVAEQAELMSQRVSRLMDISRLEAGTYQLAPEEVRVGDLVTGVVRMFERICADKGVELVIRHGEDAPCTVVVDVDVIREEVLGNLVANALRFTPEGGRITLETEGCDGGIHMVVSDTGPGIPEEHRPYIFDKHYTSDRTRAVGSGLGLAIAKEMVELHGGIIVLEDAPAGARFRVALPSRPAGEELEVPGYIGAVVGDSDAAPS